LEADLGEVMLVCLILASCCLAFASVFFIEIVHNQHRSFPSNFLLDSESLRSKAHFCLQLWQGCQWKWQVSQALYSRKEDSRRNWK
jgi:hypothetical protein